jgi:hypothetical protein
VSGFEPGANVTLIMPELGRLPARVEHAAERRLALALYVNPDRPIAWLESNEAELECGSERGIRVVRGRVTQSAHGADALVEVELDGDPALIQRRDFVRVDCVLPVSVRTSSGAVETYATNLSGNGFLLAGPASLASDDVISFALKLPGDRQVAGLARVVREGERGMKGCAFVEVGEVDRELLVRHVFDRQREQLRRGRA